MRGREFAVFVKNHTKKYAQIHSPLNDGATRKKHLQHFPGIHGRKVRPDDP